MVDDENLMTTLSDEMKTFSMKTNVDTEIQRFISDFNWKKLRRDVGNLKI